MPEVRRELTPSGYEHLSVEGAAGATRIVCVHGLWCGAEVFAPGSPFRGEPSFLERLAEGGREVHAFSFRAHGRSRLVRYPRLMPTGTYVEDLDRVLEELGLRAAVLVGWSHGGLVVQKYLEGRADVPAAVLLAPVPPRGVLPATGRYFVRHPLNFTFRMALVASMYGAVSTVPKARDLFFSPHTPDRDARAQWHFPTLQGDSFLAYLLAMRTWHLKPGRVTTPVLALQGADDAIFSADDYEDVVKRLPHCERRPFVPACGHAMTLDGAAGDVAASILEWLKTLGR